MPLPSSPPRLPCSTHHSCLKRPLTSCLLLALLVLLTLAQATPPQPQPKKAPKVGYGYRLTSLEETSDGLVGYLHLKQPTEIYGPDIPRLRLFVKHETDSRLRVHITDAENPRWEVPYNLLPRQQPPTPVTTASPSSSDTTPPLSPSLEYSGPDLVFSYTTDPFGFAVRRKSDNQPLFNTTPETASIYGPMVFKDQYLELTTSLPSSAALYGLGENTQPGGIRIKPNDPYTLYTTDISAINLNADLYGSHPVYMDVRGIGGESSSQAHGVLLLNSNGMDVFYSGESLTYKVIGGVFDLYFFSGPTPLQVIDQYTQLIGRPAAMPYWALGFHQCRWGYRNLSVVEAVVEGYAKARIPLDVIWNDDDHMDAAKDFTLDPVAYPQPKLRAFLDKIHSRGMKYVVLIDPGIAVNHTYGVFQRGMAGDVFIKYEGTPYLAQVWPGPVYFPDYLNPKGVEWWVDEIRRFHEMVPVNGLWIDMNEVSNFCTGKCELPTTHLCPDPKSKTPWVCCLDCKNITKTRWDEPPYKINASGILAPIGTKTIATSAEHYNGVKEYDAHSLYGFSQAIATHKALEPVLKPQRPFILTRSTFVGSGAYGAHWTGDNKGTWNDLKYSISTMLNFGIFGMPMVGSDICGFYPSPTEELCNRWIQLGAFYPFSRDHANFASPRQELYVWDTVAESARNALGMRYRLLPYLYTLSYRAHTSGAPIARPVFFSFPNFVQGYELSTQFLLGSSVMVSPVLKKSSTVVKVLFPPGTWYNLFDSSKAVVVKPGDEARYITLHAPWNQINVHVYQGTVLPMQRGGMISKDAKTTPFTLVVAFPLSVDEAEASGEVFVDDDERPGMELEDGKATYVQFRAKMTEGNMVKVWSDVEMGAYASKKGFVVEKVRLLGLDVEGTSAAGLAVEVGGDLVADVSGVQITTTAPSAAVHIEKLEGDIQRRSTVVEIGGLELPLGKSFSLTWKFAVKGR